MSKLSRSHGTAICDASERRKKSAKVPLFIRRGVNNFYLFSLTLKTNYLNSEVRFETGRKLFTRCRDFPWRFFTFLSPSSTSESTLSLAPTHRFVLYQSLSTVRQVLRGSLNTEAIFHSIVPFDFKKSLSHSRFFFLFRTFRRWRKIFSSRKEVFSGVFRLDKLAHDLAGILNRRYWRLIII
jgi:hypothetical protein